MKSQAFHGEVWINAHEEILAAVVAANAEPIDGGYGNDGASRRATELMQREFDTPIYTTFAINGTAANVMALKAMLDRWSAIICAEQTHVHTYEAGAFEYNLGNKILTAKTEDGKLLTAGGRVLGAVSVGDNLENAIEKAYSVAKSINFANAYFRNDIGQKALAAKEEK